MFQLTFSNQSLCELKSLGHEKQLVLFGQLGDIDFENREGDPSFGKILRDGKVYYRIRLEEFRIYFEHRGEILHIHYILPKHTWNDLIFRMKLPFSDEVALEKENFFWRYLESLCK
ncbi:MAG: cytotoxic translational repressor of toxin-antitoxin stability system [Puniceicoccales bacterium]|jgi:hypothetical protein|nr:cytotoxic translational repressor of toxin-antitoxin stability system [Puniceicoccales bacterium]